MTEKTREDLINFFVVALSTAEGKQLSGPADRAYFLNLITQVAQAVDGKSVERVFGHPDASGPDTVHGAG